LKLTEEHLVSAVILSGGRGSRMSFRDKGLQIFKKKPLIQHVIDRLQSQVTEIVISHNRNQEDYLQFGLPLVTDGNTDGDTDFLGPLSGILSCRSKINQILCFITPCDVPNIPNDLVAMMRSKIGKHDAICLSSDGRIQPLPLLIKTQAIDSIEQYLLKGNRSVKKWLESLDVLTLEVPGVTLDNINDLEDLSRSEDASRLGAGDFATPTKKPSS
jgi:molybdopterin-guanine dinucleotide biosynthesis protein A